MKLAICVLLSLAALAGADSSYQQYQNHQNYQQYPYYDQSAPSNYYQGGAAPAQRRRSIFDSVRDFFFPGNRRQDGILGGVGVGGIFAVVAVVVVGVVALAAAVTLASDLSSSGRGLDTDEWEVDHSVWMNQLQKDFEDSWSTQ